MRLALLSHALVPLTWITVSAGQTIRKAERAPDELFSGRPAPEAYAAVPAAGSAVRRDPYNPAAVSARAAALSRSGRAREAVDYLMDLKVQYLDFFPHQLALADAFAAAGMRQDAEVAYDVVANDPAYSPAERRTAEERSKNLSRVNPPPAVQRVMPATGAAVERETPAGHGEPLDPKPSEPARAVRHQSSPPGVSVQLDVTGSSQHEGTLWTSGIELSTGAFGDGSQVVFLRGIWDEIGLGEQHLVTQEDADRFQAELAWRLLTRRGIYGEVSAGGGDEGAVFGAAVGREEPSGSGWELRFRANERTEDSLLLMALGGTQDAVTFRYQRRFRERWVVDARLGWRRVEIDDDSIGEGVDLDFRLVYTLLEDRKGGPLVTVSYVAEVQRFDRKCLPEGLLEQVLRYGRREEDPLDALIDDRINRHGLVLKASTPLGARWTGFVYGGVAYEFEEGRTEGRAGAGVTAYLKDDTTLIFSVDYATSGDGSNKGEDVVSGTVKVRTSF